MAAECQVCGVKAGRLRAKVNVKSFVLIQQMREGRNPPPQARFMNRDKIDTVRTRQNSDSRTTPLGIGGQLKGSAQ
jgi:hypothetical protein